MSAGRPGWGKAVVPETWVREGIKLRDSLALGGLSLPLTLSCPLWSNTSLPQGLSSSQLGWGKLCLMCLWSSLDCKQPLLLT